MRLAWRHVAHHKHAAGIAMPAVFDDGHVDIDDIAFFERFVTGDAMANLVVDRGADGLGVRRITAAFVIERRRYAALHIDDVVMRKLVQRIGGYTCLHKRRQVVQHFGSQLAGDPHASNTGGVFIGNRHGGGLSHRAYSCSRKRCASSAAMQPVPALVIAWRYTWSCTSPAANTPGTLVMVAKPLRPLCVTI